METTKLPTAPEVGDNVYELREEGTKAARTYFAVAFKVTKVLATRFTTEDGRIWKLEKDYSGKPYAHHDYDNTTSYWDQYGAHNGYRATPSVYSAPGDREVITMEALKAKWEAAAEVSKSESNARRLALIAEEGVDGAVKVSLTNAGYMGYSELRAIKSLIGEGGMPEYVEALEQLLVGAYQKIHDTNERLVSAAERITDLAKELTR